MRSLLYHSLLVLGLVLYFDYARAASTKQLRYVRNGQTVVMLTMSAQFKVLGEDGTSIIKLDYQDTDSAASGNITNSTAEKPYTIINFIVKWNNSDEYQFILAFNSTSKQWVWNNATFVVTNEDGVVIVPLQKMINSFGNTEIVVNRNNSYVCVSPLDYTSPVISKIKVSVVWSQFQIEVMPLNNTLFDTSPHPCNVDLDDKIVPIAVGGALGLLLLLVVIIYVISYIRDRRQQSKELRSGYNRIDQPEPNHHS